MLETVELVAVPGRPMLQGWRLWCMNCGLRGDLVMTDRDEAMKLADSFRSFAEPQCQHHRELEGSPP